MLFERVVAKSNGAQEITDPDILDLDNGSDEDSIKNLPVSPVKQPAYNGAEHQARLAELQMATQKGASN